MYQNILGMNIYLAPVLRLIAQQLWRIFDKYKESEGIQIEFKYAEMTKFFNGNDYSFLKQPNNQLKGKIIEACNFYAQIQNQQLFNILKKLSQTSIVHLNSLKTPNRPLYQILGGFDEASHKRFYKIKDFLIKLCNINKQKKSKKINFYEEIKQFGLNKTFKMINSSELRFDVNVKQGQMSGRYSYFVGKGQKGWIKTQKQNIARQQFDLLLSERPFRLAIKKENQVEVSHQEVLEALNSSGALKAGVFLRYKRALRVSKNQQVQIALSQVYQPQQQRRFQCLDSLKEILQLSQETLDQWCIQIFQQFYSYEPRNIQRMQFKDIPSKFQIQSEFLPNGMNKLKNHLLKGQIRQAQKYLEVTLQDLYALFFVPHNIKMRQSTVIGEIIRKQKPQQPSYAECRLQNQFGSYMHDYINDIIQNK